MDWTVPVYVDLCIVFSPSRACARIFPATFLSLYHTYTLNSIIMTVLVRFIVLLFVASII